MSHHGLVSLRACSIQPGRLWLRRVDPSSQALLPPCVAASARGLIAAEQAELAGALGSRPSTASAPFCYGEIERGTIADAFSTQDAKRRAEAVRDQSALAARARAPSRYPGAAGGLPALLQKASASLGDAVLEASAGPPSRAEDELAEKTRKHLAAHLAGPPHLMDHSRG